jgi:NADPH:quinone reductase-like Zn-dependent oxidoreductase
MKVVLFHQHGGPEVLEYTDLPRPEPKPGEALIRLRAAALNGVEVMDLILAGELKPVLDRKYLLKDAAPAQERLWKK